jgi:hypothetical protein
MDLVSPHPYWPWKNGLLGVYPPLCKNVDADAAVLGAGSHDAIGRLADLIREGGIACDFQRRPGVYLASRKSDTEWLRTESNARLAMGIPVEYWDAAAVAGRSGRCRGAFSPWAMAATGRCTA